MCLSQGGNAHTPSSAVHSQVRFTAANITNHDGLSQKLQSSCHATQQNHLHLLIRSYIQNPAFKCKLPALGEILERHSSPRGAWLEQEGGAGQGAPRERMRSWAPQASAEPEASTCFSLFSCIKAAAVLIDKIEYECLTTVNQPCLDQKTGLIMFQPAL